jgi:hypothetical protein
VGSSRVEKLPSMSETLGSILNISLFLKEGGQWPHVWWGRWSAPRADHAEAG